MMQAFLRPARSVASVLFLGLFFACTGFVLRTAYNQADHLLLLQIDHFFDLNATQKGLVSARLKAHLEWHRQSELPKYESFLAGMKSRVGRGLVRSDVDWLYTNATKARTSLMVHIAPDMADFLVSLRPEQVIYLESHADEFSREIEKAASLSPEERLKKREADLLRMVRDWIGDLSPHQEQLVKSTASRMPDFPPAQLRFRKQRQKELLALLKSSPDRSRIDKSLHVWLVDPDAGYPPDYRAVLKLWNSEMKELILSLDASLSAEQRTHAMARLDGFIQDVRALRAP